MGCGTCDKQNELMSFQISWVYFYYFCQYNLELFMLVIKTYLINHSDSIQIIHIKETKTKDEFSPL